jgi:2'-hydroxyisoflavone reductase
MDRGPRTLVIGGTQFMGRAMVERLLQRRDDVVIMHRGRGTPFGDRVSEIGCDRNDVSAVRRALEGERFELVFDNVYDWERGTTGEQVATAALAAFAGGGLRRYVFMSSVAAYGTGTTTDHDERDELTSSDDPVRYNAQKADSERALFELHRTQGVPVTTLRPAFVYGPGNPYPREAFFWERILAGRPVIVPDDGSRRMQWAYSVDVARVALAAAGSDRAIGSAYNIAIYPPISQREFVETLARVAGKEAKLAFVPREEILAAGGSLTTEPLYFGAYLDLPPIPMRVERVRQELGLELTPLEQGLRETFDWYMRQSHPAPDFSWEDRLVRSGGHLS